jgi:hypothetical protein
MHTLTDAELTSKMKTLSDKLEHCVNISGAYHAFLDLRPMAYRTDLYRAAQLWDTGGMWLDDKIWLTQNFSRFVNPSVDEIVLPIDTGAEPAVHNGFLWSRPRHPAWEHIIQRIVSNVQQRLYDTTESSWHPWLSITGPSAYLHGLQKYQRLVATDPVVRRDLKFSRPIKGLWAPIFGWANSNFCRIHLPKEFNNHSCYAYFTFRTGPILPFGDAFHDVLASVGLAQDLRHDVIGFVDEHDHHFEADDSLIYNNLWKSGLVYCDVEMDNPNDPCIKAGLGSSPNPQPTSTGSKSLASLRKH